MTAFARIEQDTHVWEIRSVNHRFLDVSFRMPDDLRFLEASLKSSLKDRVARGKLECSLKLNTATLESGIRVNEPLLRRLTLIMGEVSEIAGIKSSPDLLQLMKWPDVLMNDQVNVAETLGPVVTEGFSQAIDELVEMRAREGAELSEIIGQRLKDVTLITNLLREHAPAIEALQHEKLVSRVEKLEITVDPSRLETELAILAQKHDVMEELDRLDTHISEVHRNLNLVEPVGRRLDFLMQELNREANTLSSKAMVAETTLQAVDLKVIIEQMREQIQNIE